MKLVHTSDWHLGRTTYKESRAADHDAVITEILQIARQARPDLIVHSGDLFDLAHPSNTDVDRAAAALHELAAIAPTVLVCGNHDSPHLLSAFRHLAGNSRLHLVDRIRTPAEGGLLTFPTATGHRIRLAAMPFLHVNRVVDAFGDADQWGAEYAARVRGMERVLGDALLDGLDPRTEFTVFAAHLHVGGVTFCGSERGAHISDTYETDLDGLPEVTYAAFGHLHKPQPLPGQRVVGRYAGSPLQLDFGEIADVKSIVVVEAEPGRRARTEVVPISAGRRLRRFDGTFAELEAIAPAVGDDICQIIVRTPSRVPTLNEQVRALLPRATIVDIQNPADDQYLEILTSENVATDAEPDLPTLYGEYLAEQGTSGAPAQRVLDVFRAVMTAVATEIPLTFPEEAHLQMPVPTAGGDR